MPLVTPIAGASEAPAAVTLYAANMSIDVRAGTRDESLQSLGTISNRIASAGLVSIEPVRDILLDAPMSVLVGQFTNHQVDGSANISTGEGFVILADLLSSALAGDSDDLGPLIGGTHGGKVSGQTLTPGSFAYTDINAELKVNGTVVPIKSFRYEVPTGRLGSTLNVTLASPLLTSVPNGALISFKLKIVRLGIPATYTLVDNGRMEGRTYTVAYRGGPKDGPADEITISSIDVLADKFNLAPRIPVVMFDPIRVRYDNVNEGIEQAIRDANGRIIRPILEPIVGLSMYTILARAYSSIGGIALIPSIAQWSTQSWWPSIVGRGTDQVGVGLSGIVTNIPNYLVRRADFTLEGSWHDGAQPTVAMYAPLYFITGTILYILNVDAPLPFGAVPHTISLADHKQLSQRLEFKPEANAVLLTYQYSGNDPSEDPQKIFAEITSEEVSEQGTLGQQGYSKVTTRRRDRTYFMSDTPDSVLDRLPLSVDIETLQHVIFYDAFGGTVDEFDAITHKETVEYHYEGDLKTKQTRVVKALLYNGLYNGLFEVENEVTDIDWTEDPINPGVKLQSAVRTDISSLCVLGDETETVSESALTATGATGTVTFTRPVPILLAQSSGIITDTWTILGTVTIKTIRETLKLQKGNQYDVEVIEHDYINNTIKKTYTQPVSGTVSHDPYETKSRTVLLRNATSEAAIGPRVPVPVNAYELPRQQALALGNRVLYRLANPLTTLPIALAGVDFVIARGSIIRGQLRNGTYGPNYVVTGYSINGDNLGREGHRISQSLDATELLS